MADYITTDATLMATGLITEELKQRLTPGEWVDLTGAAGPWVKWHTEAWAEMLRHYAARAEPLEESDITDTDPLQTISLHYVLYLAWMSAGQQDSAQMWFKRYKELLSEINPTVSGGTAIDAGMSITMYRA